MPKQKKLRLTKKGRFDSRGGSDAKAANFFFDLISIILSLIFSIILFFIKTFYKITIEFMKFIIRILALPFRKK